jgi:hypothetical protein
VSWPYGTLRFCARRVKRMPSSHLGTLCRMDSPMSRGGASHQNDDPSPRADAPSCQTPKQRSKDTATPGASGSPRHWRERPRRGSRLACGTSGGTQSHNPLMRIRSVNVRRGSRAFAATQQDFAFSLTDQAGLPVAISAAPSQLNASEGILWGGWGASKWALPGFCRSWWI